MKRHVLITGGSRGIGAQTVRDFARTGDHVSFLYRNNHPAAQALIDELTAEGLSVSCRAVDITDREATLSALESLKKQHNEIDVFIHNAGVASQCLITDMTHIEYQELMDIHLGALFHITQSVLPAMIRQHRGCIITVSSIWGITGASCEVAYSTAKAGVIGFTKALAKEVGPSGIRVNCVAPGVIETDMMKEFSQADKDALIQETPLCRLGTPRDISTLIHYLASDQASFITGQVISPNGGIIA